jgi:hypothetical protein
VAAHTDASVTSKLVAGKCEPQISHFPTTPINYLACRLRELSDSDRGQTVEDRPLRTDRGVEDRPWRTDRAWRRERGSLEDCYLKLNSMTTPRYFDHDDTELTDVLLTFICLLRPYDTASRNHMSFFLFMSM